MSFWDAYMPEEVPGYPCAAAPRFNTNIAASAGGGEQRNRNWQHPLHRYSLPEAVGRQPHVLNTLKDFWLNLGGPHESFAWRDPLDKATVAHKANQPDAEVIAAISASDQTIGTADGFTDTFQLVKTYAYANRSYERTIHLPVLDTVIVAIDGNVIPDTDYTVSRPGGEITFDVPPDPDDYVGPGIITAGFLFDVEVRFESDDAFEGILRTWQVGGFADITLIEVRPC